jgi:hypothetical protein
LEGIEIMLKLTADQLHEAIDHLYEALRLLKSVLKEMRSGAMRGARISEKLAKAWFEVNCCRVHTQSDVNLEELNLDSMGLINDAKCMMDSLMSWEKGLTPHGKLFIGHNIISAAADLTVVVNELEGLLYRQKAGESSICA